MEPIELLADHVHLLAVHRAEHLDQHAHRLLELVEHLLLHQAELVDQRHERRVGALGLEPAGDGDVGGDDLDAGSRGDDGERRGRHRQPRSEERRQARRGAEGRPTGDVTAILAGGQAVGHLAGRLVIPDPGLPASDPHAVPPDPQHVAVGQGGEAHRLGVDGDAPAAADVNDPEPRRGTEQAGVERRDARVGQPEFAALGRPDQGHHPVHRPSRRLGWAVEELQVDHGQRLVAIAPHGQGRFPARLGGPGLPAHASPATRRITNGPISSRPPPASQPDFRVPPWSHVPVRLSRSTQNTCPATAWM